MGIRFIHPLKQEYSLADQESRCLKIETEYVLHDEAYETIIKTWGLPEIDLFASHSNAKCLKYVSWKQNPGSIAVDAFTISWSPLKFYAFPPFSLISRTLNKILEDRAEGILVVPFWSTQPWYPLFIGCLVSKPIFFRPSPKLLLSPFRESHPLWRRLTLVAGKLSGKHS